MQHFFELICVCFPLWYVSSFSFCMPTNNRRNFISPNTIRVEAGLTYEMEQYDRNPKARQLMGHVNDVGGKRVLERAPSNRSIESGSLRQGEMARSLDKSETSSSIFSGRSWGSGR